MYYSELVKKACVIMYDAHKEDKDKGGYHHSSTPAPQETKNSFLKKSNNLHRKPAEIIRFQRVFWSE